MGRIGEEFVRSEVLNDTNSLDVNIQDQVTRAFDLPFHQTLGTTTLAADMTDDAYSFIASSGHGIQAAESIAIYDVAAQEGFSAGVLTVVDDLITIDSPAVAAMAAATSIVARSTREMNVNGAITRQVFEVLNPFPIAEDVTRIMFMMITTGAPTLAKFGDLTALTRGIVFRTNNGNDVNYFNAKSNGDLALLMHDVTFYSAAGVGQDGLCARYSFAGPEKHGVALRLEQGDALELIVQDDLTSLTSFKAIAVGHETSGEPAA